MVGAGHTMLRWVSFTVTLYVASGVITSLHFFVVGPAQCCLPLVTFMDLHCPRTTRVAGREATEE